MSTTTNPYNVSFNGVKLDPYRLFTVYNIAHPAQQHAIKKLLRAGRSNKTLVQDIEETVIALNRWLEMINEEAALKKSQYPTTQAEALEKFEQERETKAAQGRKPGRSRHGKLKPRGHRRTAAAGRRSEEAREESKDVVSQPEFTDKGIANFRRDSKTTVTLASDGPGNPC